MKRILSFSSFQMLWRERAFWLAVFCLVCGLAAGSYFGMQADSSGIGELAQTVQEQSAMPLSWKAVPVRLGETLGWIIAVIGIGLLPGRRLLLTALLVLRGFLLGFTISIISLKMGLLGVYLSFVTTGIGAMLSVPAFLFSTAAVLICASEGSRGQFFRALRRYRAVLCSSTVLCLLSAGYRLTAANLLLRFFR
ncbi:MAG: hypothetical protein ACI4PQ_01370 [Butyricicoccaceae bacterium]